MLYTLFSSLWYLVTSEFNERSLGMANSLSETQLHGIMAVVFIKTNIQSNMMYTTTTIPYGCIS